MSSAAARSGARLSPRTRWRLALGLLLAGAAIGGVAIYTPWAVGYVHPNIQQAGQFTIRLGDSLFDGLPPLMRSNPRIARLLIAALGLAGAWIAARGSTAQASSSASLASSSPSPTASSVGEKM